MIASVSTTRSPLGKTSPAAQRGESGTDANRIAVSHASSLVGKANGVTRTFVRLAESRHAGTALRELQRQEIEATLRVSSTAIAVAETQIRNTLIATAMPSVGAITTTLTVATQQVESALTNTAQAGALAIVANRSATREAIADCFGEGQLSAEERDALVAQADADHAGDLARMRARVEASREAIQQLFRHATQHLAASLDRPVV